MWSLTHQVHKPPKYKTGTWVRYHRTSDHILFRSVVLMFPWISLWFCFRWVTVTLLLILANFMLSNNLIWWLHLYYLDYFLLWHITHYHTVSLCGACSPSPQTISCFYFLWYFFGCKLLVEEVLKGFLEKLEVQFPSALFLNRRKT